MAKVASYCNADSEDGSEDGSESDEDSGKVKGKGKGKKRTGSKTEQVFLRLCTKTGGEEKNAKGV
jgi:hypothetical protein